MLDFWIPILGLTATALLVVVGLLNFSIFRRQLEVAREQIATAVHHLELTRKQPDLYLIQRAIAEASSHVRVMVDKPYLRPYFYEGRQWQEGDRATRDELLAMGELIGHLDAEQDRAREEFDASFARFSRPASIARLDRLGGSR